MQSVSSCPDRSYLFLSASITSPLQTLSSALSAWQTSMSRDVRSQSFSYSRMSHQQPMEPFTLRICMTEQHRWQKVSQHLTVCPGNGCSVDVCVYIRELCSHNLITCQKSRGLEGSLPRRPSLGHLTDCDWCNKIIQWYKHHQQDCSPQKCRYYSNCMEVKRNILRLKFFSLSEDSIGERKLSSSTCSSESSTPRRRRYMISTSELLDEEEEKLQEEPVIIPERGPTLEPEYNMDTSSAHFQRGAFAAEQNLYQQSLRERLPEDVETVSSIVDTRSAMRNRLLCQFHQQQSYQEGRHWKRVKEIGKGSCGVTFCIQDIESNVWLAMKEEKDTDDAVDEACISLRLSDMVDLHPPNIVEFYGVSFNPLHRRLQLFLELMPCCMQNYLFHGGPLSVENAHNYACQLFEALDFLHNKLHLVHSDLKPGNLLVDENIQRIKVADFGCARVLEDSHLEYCHRGDANAGTLHYNPPEHFSEFRCSFGLDVWQAGGCFLAMMIGRRPWRCVYPDCTGGASVALRRIVQQKQISMITSYCSPDTGIPFHPVPAFLDGALRTLLERCLSISYQKRPTARECLRLLAESDVVSSESRKKWLSQLHGDATGSSSPHSTCTSATPSSPLLVDVYLGSYYHDLDSVYFNCTGSTSCCMLPGWIGSLPCDPSMSYHDLSCRLPHLPICRFLGQNFCLKLCDKKIAAQLVWSQSKMDLSPSEYSKNPLSITTPYLVSFEEAVPSNLVQLDKAVILIPQT